MHPKEGPQRKVLIILALALLAIGAVVAGQWQLGPALNVANTSTGALPDVPAVSFPDLQGGTVSLEQHRGKVVLLNFWATYCAPCLIEMPWFADFQEKYGEKGFVVIGVGMDAEGKSIIEPFLQKEKFEMDGRPVKINYPIVLGDDAIGEKFGLFGLPTTLVINREGKITKRFVGLVSHDAYVKEIEAQLGN